MAKIYFRVDVLLYNLYNNSCNLFDTCNYTHFLFCKLKSLSFFLYTLIVQHNLHYLCTNRNTQSFSISNYGEK